MKKLNLISLLIVLSFISNVFAQEIITKTFNVKNFNKISTSNGVNVKLIVDGSEKVIVKCEDFAMEHVVVDVSGDELELSINTKESLWGKSNRTIQTSVKIIVHAKSINEIKSSSGSSVVWDKIWKPDELKIRCSSAADIKWQGIMTCTEADITVSSAADVRGNINANEFTAKVSSASSYKGTVNAKKAEFDVSSAGSMSVDGTIDFMDIEASSGSTFRGKKIVYKNAEAKTGSGADVYLSKSGNLVDKTNRTTGVHVK